jgi:hypothetical protein
VHATPLETARTTWGKSGRTVSADDSVQSEPEAFLAGLAAGVADLVPESPDPDVLDDFDSDDFDDFDSDDFDSGEFDDFDSDDDDSVDDVLDDDFDFPLRLSVL